MLVIYVALKPPGAGGGRGHAGEGASHQQQEPLEEERPRKRLTQVNVEIMKEHICLHTQTQAAVPK